jgi:hypothetical protein
MMGVPGDPGIIPRTVVDVFASIKATAAAQPETIFMVRMSYVELYNNSFRNLLDWRLVEGGDMDGPVDPKSADPGSAFRAARADGRIEVGEGAFKSVRERERERERKNETERGGGGGGGGAKRDEAKR